MLINFFLNLTLSLMLNFSRIFYLFVVYFKISSVVIRLVIIYITRYLLSHGIRNCFLVSNTFQEAKEPSTTKYV